jgi:two-component system nitrate/nitrite response regulator NarP
MIMNRSESTAVRSNRNRSICVLAPDESEFRHLLHLLENSFDVTRSTTAEVAGRCHDGRIDALILNCAASEIRAEVMGLRAELPELPIVVVAAGDSRHGVRRAMRAGADGYVRHDQIDCALAVTVHAVIAGQICVSKSGRVQLARSALSVRERQILQLLTLGLTNQQIANRLYLSENTVKSHVASSLRKLDASSRAEAASIFRDSA